MDMEDTLYREAGGRARKVGLSFAPEKVFRLLPEICETVAYIETGAEEATMTRALSRTRSLMRHLRYRGHLSGR